MLAKTLESEIVSCGPVDVAICNAQFGVVVPTPMTPLSRRVSLSVALVLKVIDSFVPTAIIENLLNPDS